MTYDEADCIRALHEAKRVLGHSPSCSEYRNSDIDGPSNGTIIDMFGGWNAAKDEAGIEHVTRTKPISDVPENVSLTQSEWESLTRDRRQKLSTRAEWSREKVKRGCSECGYDEHPIALDWHHQEEKSESVSKLIGQGYSNERIEDEVDSCVVLCANCHRLKKDTHITHD